MKNEVAFKLSHGCELYNQYMVAKDEKIKFNDLAKRFASKHFGTDEMTYRMLPTLYCSKDTSGQTCKAKSGSLYKYKKNSALQKAWESEVTSHINFGPIDALDFWYWGLISHGSYSLWSYNDDVYGYLSSKTEEPKLPDGAQEIRMSEYYAVIEDMEEKG